jgi:hypothetical protein
VYRVGEINVKNFNFDSTLLSRSDIYIYRYVSCIEKNSY